MMTCLQAELLVPNQMVSTHYGGAFGRLTYHRRCVSWRGRWQLVRYQQITAKCIATFQNKAHALCVGWKRREFPCTNYVYTCKNGVEWYAFGLAITTSRIISWHRQGLVVTSVGRVQWTSLGYDRSIVSNNSDFLFTSTHLNYVPVNFHKEYVIHPTLIDFVGSSIAYFPMFSLNIFYFWDNKLH